MDEVNETWAAKIDISAGKMDEVNENLGGKIDNSAERWTISAARWMK